MQRLTGLDATFLAQRLARYDGVAAGRTSDRLRNPTNAPPPWAAALVRAHAGERARDVDGFVVELGDKIGLLRPISHQPMCRGCSCAMMVPYLTETDTYAYHLPSSCRRR